jgi:hypothetical protein
MSARDEEIQDALDRVRGTGDEPDARAGDADRAAYAIVYAALEDDAGFALPADFAERIAAQAMPAAPRPSIFERWVLPVLMIVCSAIAVPAVVPGLARGFEVVFGAAGGGVAPGGVAAGVLLLVAAADHLARRRGWAPRT